MQIHTAVPSDSFLYEIHSVGVMLVLEGVGINADFRRELSHEANHVFELHNEKISSWGLQPVTS